MDFVIDSISKKERLNPKDYKGKHPGNKKSAENKSIAHKVENRVIHR